MEPDADATSVAGSFDFQVLGPLTVLSKGQPIELGGRTQRAILAVLLIRRKQIVTFEHLGREVWDDDENHTASIHVAISKLRRSLGPGTASTAGGDQTYIRTAPGGYSLVVEDVNYDYARFRELVRLGNTQRDSNNPGAAGRAYRSAEAEWRGERGLQDLGELGFAEAFAVAVDRDLQGAVQDRAEAELAQGRQQELIAELGLSVRRWPDNPTLLRLLLTALVREGLVSQAEKLYEGFKDDNESQALERSGLRRAWFALLNGEELAGPYGGHFTVTPAGPDEVPGSATTIVGDESAQLRAELIGPDGARTSVRGRCIVGRKPGSDLVLDDDRASRTHASIAATPAGFVLQDLGSTNGTLLDGRPVHQVELLSDGSVITIGRTELEFRLPS